MQGEPKRQTIETRSTQKEVAEQATLVQTGSWRSALTHTRQLAGAKLAQTRNTTTSEAPEASQVDNPDETPTRVLQWQHFESALSEISPSSTEDGTLPELKKVRSQSGTSADKCSGLSSMAMGAQEDRPGRVLVNLLDSAICQRTRRVVMDESRSRTDVM